MADAVNGDSLETIYVDRHGTAATELPANQDDQNDAPTEPEEGSPSTAQTAPPVTTRCGCGDRAAAHAAAPAAPWLVVKV